MRSAQQLVQLLGARSALQSALASVAEPALVAVQARTISTHFSAH
jgi:hypothetical protein